MSSNVTVTFTPANVTVDETNLTVNVSETTSNIVVSSIASVANAQLVRDQLSVTDTGGDGSLTYSNTTGVFTYTGSSASEVRAHFSNTSPITLSSGVIGIDSNAVFSGKTTDDLIEGSTNLYLNGAGTTDNLTEGSTNLYYTNARANAAFIDSLDNITTAISSDSNITTTANVNSASFTTTANATVGANLNVLGNLEVTGNINYREVEDLLVRDQTITLNFGNASANDVQIISDRSGSGFANTDIKWNETTDKWTFTNDGSTYYNIPTSTTDLAEGTNLYYTTARQNTDFDTRFATKDSDDLPEGSTNLYFTTARANSAIGAYTGTISPNNVLVTGKNITLNSGNAAAGDAFIHVDRESVDPAANIQTLEYDDISSSAVTAQDSLPYGLTFNNDGTKLFIAGSSNTSIFSYSLSTAYDPSTMAYDSVSFDVSTQVTTGDVNLVEFNNDGTKMYVAGVSIFQYSLSSAYDISTATYDSVSLTTNDPATGLRFNNDGTKVFALTYGPSVVTEYICSTPYDLDTATFEDDININSQDIFMEGLVFNSDGTILIAAGRNLDRLFQYNLTTGFDLSTSSYIANISITEEPTMRDIATNNTHTQLYIIGDGNKIVYQYSFGDSPFIKWSEADDKFGFSNDGSNVVFFAEDTDGLTEGSTNLYYTTDRANTAIDNYTGSFANATINTTNTITTTSNIDTSANINAENVIANTNIISNADITALGDIFASDIEVKHSSPAYQWTNLELRTGGTGGLIGMSNTTGNLPLLINTRSQLSNIDIRVGNVSAVNFTSYNPAYEPQALFTSNILYPGNVIALRSDGNINAEHVIANTNITSNANITATANINAAGGTLTGVVTSNSDLTTTANVTADTVLTDKIESGASANLNLKGQADGIHFDTTIDSTESRIVDLDTTGYSIADVTLPADFTAGTNTPGFYTLITTTAGSTTVTASSPIGVTYFPALRGPTYATPIFTLSQTLESAVTTSGSSWAGAPFGTQTANGLNNSAAGLYGQDKGWNVFDVTTASIATLFPANAYVTGISTNTITMSENALVTATGRAAIFNPGMAQTSDSKTTVKYYANTHTGSNSEFISNYGRLSNFDLPETLSNTTFDAISYGNTTSVTTTVTMKNISDFAGSDESATRFKRGLLIGAATTPDPVSARETLNQPSTLGVILESDGESFNDGLNTPAPRFLINNYSGGLDDLTSYPVWAQTGATGNLTLDLPQIKAPSLTLKSFRGAKSTANTTSYLMQAGDVVGKIAFSPAQTTGTGFQGTDAVNPPAAITVDVGSANINTGVANAYMHITTTPYSGTNLGYSRNNANADSGANQQTNFTTKDGNLTLAAQTDGMITLAPTPDYGDAANSTVWTRYPGTTHEYHSFLDAKFLGSRAGTLVEIQPKSGTTTGSGGLAYDSKGNATLRISTHEANSDIKQQWDITNEQSSGNLVIRDHTNSTNVMHFDGDRVFVDEVLRLQNLTTTEINALASPQSGDTVFCTDSSPSATICFYNGTAWQKVSHATL